MKSDSTAVPVLAVAFGIYRPAWDGGSVLWVFASPPGAFES